MNVLSDILSRYANLFLREKKSEWLHNWRQYSHAWEKMIYGNIIEGSYSYVIDIWRRIRMQFMSQPMCVLLLNSPRKEKENASNVVIVRCQEQIQKPLIIHNQPHRKPLPYKGHLSLLLLAVTSHHGRNKIVHALPDICDRLSFLVLLSPRSESI